MLPYQNKYIRNIRFDKGNNTKGKLYFKLLLTIIICKIIFIINKLQIISLLNSHLGNNLTTKESKKSNKNNMNKISKIYNHLINQ